MSSRREKLPPAMAGLPDEIAQRLLASAKLVNVAAGRSPIAQGSASTCVYFIVEGRMQVTLFSVSGREVILRDLGQGEMFGELAAIDERPRSASVVALTDSVLATVDAADFRAATLHSPDGADWLARRLAGQIRGLTKKLFESSTLPVRSRLHCELLRLCAAADTGGAEIVIEPAPTHAVLASRVGTHREAVTREMSYLARRSVLRQEGRRLLVTDRLALAQLVRDATGEPADET